MRVSRTAVRAAVVSAVAVGTIALVHVSPASAAPTGCRYGVSHTLVWAYCSGGVGGYQAVTQCDAPFAFDYERRGPVQSVGSGLESHARCSNGHRPYDYYLEKYVNA